ncbi:hypothetical protein M2459_000547 [Parabacteroides sp. PF5-5]|uniref:DUF3943 domain-containing protein n=2 Tax=Parabacteroides TaxID=375288 RepID=UPI0024736E82|nr:MULTISPECIES: DUF3943 domain-containing protein [unclassified Parabacteroides]MDH6303520.1 hypothetical protein [Parabacteroides sp. PH5-39]MDH6314842.1 hypothetical protein [Parabacteroides sp. PF5-13]MDH6318179.1 hypothetical protein [Parabacteroides sp. PH5-13]MDH6321889.1 hypothetical protein [Parabacteroides sp. PH5-8]MDH6326013.1 hypothetical protein [Parabacteroides sp. PH5-41]
MMKHAVSVLILFLSCHFCAYSQIGIRKLTSIPRLADSVDVAYHSKKNGWRAGGMVFGVNMAVWTFDRFIQKGDFAYINGHTIKENFRHGFIWDNDQMGTNMFLHPYHGSLYYNSARSNGYNYWQSGLYSFAGSWMWEMFMECEFPSTNDIIATPIGGLALGEVFYRTTDLILDDRARGNARFGRELAALLISPTRGLTRIINGEAWRKRPTSGKQFGVPEVYVEVSMGIRALELEDDIFDQGVGFGTEINIEYGDRFDAENKKPYDYFSVKAAINAQASQPILGQLNIIGRLASKDIWDTKKDYMSIGLYQHFDYYDSDTISAVSAKTPYKFCTPASFGVGLIYQNKRFKRWDVDAFAHANAIILGGALSDYYQVDERNYNLASGFSTKVGFNFVYKKGKFAASTFYEVYRMYTWKGYPDDIDWDDFNSKTLDAQGDKSKAILHAVSLRMDLRLKNNFYLTNINTAYSRETHYKKFENVLSTTGESRLMLTYKF